MGVVFSGSRKVETEKLLEAERIKLEKYLSSLHTSFTKALKNITSTTLQLRFFVS